MRELAVALVCSLLVVGLAGCLGDDQTDPGSAQPIDASSTTPAGNATATPDAVIAFIDSGINPYHADFRTNASRADQHPSTYLPGYPEDAQALNLTFDHGTLEDAVRADCEVWEEVEQETLYWVPGTRIVGLIRPTEEDGGVDFSCEDADDALPPFIAGPVAYHGTMVASRGAGEAYGACPECLVVSVKRTGYAHKAGPDVLWAADQPWIDIQSNSWGPDQRPCPEPLVGCANPSFTEAVEDAASRQPAFWGTGNSFKVPFTGVNTGFVGHPSQMDPRMTPSTIRVSGLDNGHALLWTGSSPHLVSDACRAWQAIHDSMGDRNKDAWGGSAATPYAAGIGGKILLEARSILEDDRTGVRDGVLAEGDGDGIDTGPLADGTFTIDELKRVIYTTADPRPEEIEADGDGCQIGSHGRPGLWTLPVAWEDVPEGPAGIPIIGYGAATPATAEIAAQVLRGQAPMPDRASEDRYFQVDDAYRETFHEAYTGSADGASATSPTQPTAEQLLREASPLRDASEDVPDGLEDVLQERLEDLWVPAIEAAWMGTDRTTGHGVAMEAPGSHPYHP